MPEAGTPPPAAPPAGDGGGGSAPAEDDEELRAEFAELERELLAAPAEEVVANHCYGLFQLAALHLGQQPPNLETARLAIDAFGAVVEAIGPRLGAQAQNFTDGLAQLRLAYVQLHSLSEAEGSEPPPAGGGEDAEAPEAAEDAEAPEGSGADRDASGRASGAGLARPAVALTRPATPSLRGVLGGSMCGRLEAC